MGCGNLPHMPPFDTHPASLPLEAQLTALRSVLSANRTLLAVLDGAEALAAPGWYLAAGCVVQTIWNVMTGRPPEQGIKDYDLIYHDASDLSWEAEDAVIRKGASLFADIPGAPEVEIRNQARVPLWYEAKFGVPALDYHSTEDGIDSFGATTCCIGIHQAAGGWQVYAPHGLSDAFNLVVRPNPNPKQWIPHVYHAKAERWKQLWPELTVLPWPAAS
ncbi:nucleotidyltransferase family protein [Flindersiella endophytica]